MGVNEALAVCSSPVASYSWEVQAQMTLTAKGLEKLATVSFQQWQMACSSSTDMERRRGKSWSTSVPDPTMVNQLHNGGEGGCAKLKTNINCETFSSLNCINAKTTICQFKKTKIWEHQMQQEDQPHVFTHLNRKTRGLRVLNFCNLSKDSRKVRKLVKLCSQCCQQCTFKRPLSINSQCKCAFRDYTSKTLTSPLSLNVF